jgi:hypothetical protein
MTTSSYNAVATTSDEQFPEIREDVYRQPISNIGCFSGVQTTGNAPIDLFSSFKPSSGDCHVTYSNYTNSLSSNLHHLYDNHGRTHLDRQLASNNQLSSLVNTGCAAQGLVTDAQHNDSFTNSTTVTTFHVTEGNLLPPTTSQNIDKSGRNVSFMSMLQDSATAEVDGSDVFVDSGFSVPIVTSAEGSPSVALVPHTPGLPTILEEMNVDV